MQLPLPGFDDPKTEPEELASEPTEPPRDANHDANHETAVLSAALESALLRELQEAYRQLNASLFRNALKPALLELSNSKSWLGRWHSVSRTLEIGRNLAVHQAWTVVIEVLKHEMAHQYVDEVLGDPQAGHGPGFREVCARLGVDPRGSGVPCANVINQDEERLLSRVARLLALAESPNENEAQAAMSAAQRLMLRYNIDQSEAQAPNQPHSFRQVGRITGRVSESERLLARLLVDHFFVEVIWVPAYEPSMGKSGSVLEVCGTEANLEMAVYVHSFMTHTAQRLWEAHKKKMRIGSNRDRQTFLAGVMLGFHERMLRERKTHEGEGLVWKGDAELDRYLRKRHPHIRRIRLRGNPRTEARERGKQAGRDIVLHKPVGASTSNRGNLLLP